jgi:hypothetical protein
MTPSTMIAKLRTIVDRKAVAGGLAAVLLVSLVACSSQTAEEKARDQQQQAAASAPGVDTLEIKNLKEKKRREENANAIGYVYLVSFGKVLGYYVTKGKVSSNGSQAGPEQDIVWTCKSNNGCSPVVVDSAQDDGSFGTGDPGIFFFTAEGVKVVSDLDYMQSDQPLPFNVPKLNPQP